MPLPICDRPDRIGARVFLAVAGVFADATACPCCSFWRGTLFGAALAALAAFLLA